VGPSEFDARHMLVFNYLYDLPFFKNHSTLPASCWWMAD
jgi:hypothetical protein